jgi:hypothetical protein
MGLCGHHLPMDDLEKIVVSMAEAAEHAGVKVVSGDTTVVPKGAVDKIFINTTGIGAVVCGDPDGAAPTWADIVALETEVAVDNADIGSLAYLTNAKMRGKLKATDMGTDTGKMVWPADVPVERQIVNGYRAAVSNQVPSNIEKGGSGTTLSAMIFGNWADLVIAMWGTLELTVDPYTHSTSGAVRVVALQDIDIGVRHAESFAAIEDAVTT